MTTICKHSFDAFDNSPHSRARADMMIDTLKKICDDSFEVVYNVSSDVIHHTYIIFSCPMNMLQSKLLAVTDALSFANGLYIEVFSRIPNKDGIAGKDTFIQSYYKNKLWSFCDTSVIVTQVEQLRLQGLDIIRRHIQQHGGIYVPDTDVSFPAVYFDHDGYAATSPYSKIQLAAGKIVVDLEDGAGLTEDDLSITHVLQIFQFIKQ